MTPEFLRLENHGGAPAVIDGAGTVTSYHSLRAGCDRIAEKLPRRALVAIEAHNTIATVTAYLSTLRSGHVGLMIDGDLKPDLRERLYDRFGVAIVLSGRSEGLEPVLHQRAVVSAPMNDRLCLLLSTSGSTGSPKLVRLSRHNLDANARSIVEYLGLQSDERPFLSLPLHYSYGLSILNSHLTVGAAIVLTDAAVTTREYWTAFQNAGATSLSGVPATWEILRRLRFANMELPTLRYGTQAGGRLPASSAAYFADWADRSTRRFYVMYGQTEATARMSYVPSEHLARKTDSIGIAIPNGTLSIRSPESGANEATLAPGAVGELVYRGPNVMLGYAESALDLDRGDECDGVLRTGDLGYQDEEGYFFIIGRAKRFAKVFGNRINLDEVESLLDRHGIIGAVTQKEDRLLIAIEGSDPTVAHKLVSSELQVHLSATRVVRVDAIPKTPAGKVSYPDVELLFEAPPEAPARS